MAVALRPAWFLGGAAAPDGSAWELFGEEYRTNPRLLVGEEESAMLRVWGLFQGGGFGGVGHLPEAGGSCDQALLNLEALAIMNAAKAEFEDQYPAKGRRARR